MAIKLTEKEIGFIRSCTIDEQGVVVEMPSNPFPSFYRKGIIKKRKDHFVVDEDFRNMFRLDGADAPEQDDDATSADDTQCEQAAYGDAPAFKWPEEMPEDGSAFRAYVSKNLELKATKGKACDEFAFIDPVKGVFELAFKLSIGNNATCEDASSIGRRKSWRIALSKLCAGYFNCDTQVVDRDVYFSGEEYMTSACKLAYTYLYKLGNRIAQRAYDDVLMSGDNARGVYNDVANAYLGEVTKRFNAWEAEHAMAHDVIDPETGEKIGEVTGEYDD